MKLNCIMLIDDDYATNVYHKIVIEEGGFARNIIVKNSAEDALSYLTAPFDEENPKPNLIFLDINMPRMDGWEFLEAYNNLSPAQRADHIIVMLSTSSDPDDIKRAAENPHIKEYQSKPITVEMIQAILGKYCTTEINA